MPIITATMDVIVHHYDQGESSLITDTLVDTQTKALLTADPNPLLFVIQKPDNSFLRYALGATSVIYAGLTYSPGIVRAAGTPFGIYLISFSLDQGGDWWGRFFAPSGYGQHTKFCHLIVNPVTLQ